MSGLSIPLLESGPRVSHLRWDHITFLHTQSDTPVTHVRCQFNVLALKMSPPAPMPALMLLEDTV